MIVTYVVVMTLPELLVITVCSKKRVASQDVASFQLLSVYLDSPKICLVSIATAATTDKTMKTTLFKFDR